MTLGNLVGEPPGGVGERDEPGGHPCAGSLVQCRAHVLPATSGEREPRERHDRLLRDLRGLPADLVAGAGDDVPDAVEAGDPGVLGAVLGEPGDRGTQRVGLPEGFPAGQRDAGQHAVGHGRPAAGVEPVAVAAPRRAPRQARSARADQQRACGRGVARRNRGPVQHPCGGRERDRPEHDPGPLVEHGRGRSERGEGRLHLAEIARRQEPGRQISQRVEEPWSRRELARQQPGAHDAGASLPPMLIFSISGWALGDIVTTEEVATEIVRTLVGSIGLVASVPITTAVAATWRTRSRPEPSDQARPPVRLGVDRHIEPTGTGYSHPVIDQLTHPIGQLVILLIGDLQTDQPVARHTEGLRSRWTSEGGPAVVVVADRKPGEVSGLGPLDLGLLIGDERVGGHHHPAGQRRSTASGPARSRSCPARASASRSSAAKRASSSGA